MRSEAGKRAPRAHYPAPYALIDLWVEHGGNAEAMQKAEISSFAKLLVSDTAQNLVRVFFLRENLKNLADGHWDGSRVHVIGAGAMGGDIAAWCAWHGFIVSLADTKPEPIAGAIKRAAELFGKIGRDNRRRIRDALDRLIPDLKGDGVATADLIIEAVPENLDLKRKIFSGIEPKMKPTRSSPPTRRASRSNNCARDCRGRSGSSASISSIRCRACSSSRSSATTRSPTTCSPTRAPSSAASTGFRRR